jgi:hypothetical protein
MTFSITHVKYRSDGKIEICSHKGKGCIKIKKYLYSRIHGQTLAYRKSYRLFIAEIKTT